MDRDTFDKARKNVAQVSEDLIATRASLGAERLERLVHQAEVSMDKLTGSPEWDSFVQIVQSRLEAAKDDHEHLAYDLAHPSFSPGVHDMMRQRIELASQHGVIATLEWITGLPREIMDATEAAELDGEELPKAVRGTPESDADPRNPNA